MQYFDLDAIKAKKRNFLLVFALALVPLAALAGYRLYGIIMELAATIQDGVIVALIAFLFHIFVGAILLVLISALWLGVCCYLPLKRLHDDYSRTVFPQAVTKNPDYFYVKLLDSPRLLNGAELVDARVIHPDSMKHQKDPEYLMGQYKSIDFEIAPLALSYGEDEEVSGTIAVFTGLSKLFREDELVHISCSTEHDVFAEYLPEKRGLEVKKRIATDDYRTGVIAVPENQALSEEQLMLLEQLVGDISRQTLARFYIIFSQGRVYFIDDGCSLIIKLPLWRKIEKEIQDLENNGIANINMFVDTFLRITDSRN